jgi:hypothetical protein
MAGFDQMDGSILMTGSGAPRLGCELAPVPGGTGQRGIGQRGIGQRGIGQPADGR